MTLKSLQIELNVLREELNLNKKELVDVKEELNHVKDEMKKEKEKTEDPKVKDIIKCKKCDKRPAIADDIKIHQESFHGGQKTKCKYCSKTFVRNCELEVHLRSEHKEMEMFECEHCDKTFVLKWRLEKHVSMHKENNTSVRFCHYHNNDKVCPFAEIGCMFKHEEAQPCKYQVKCLKKLCQFKHSQATAMEIQNCEQCDYIGNSKENLETHISESHTTEESVEDEENFNLYVEHNFSEVYERFISGKRQIHCYFCNYVSKCKTMVNIQEEVNDHLKTYHSEIIETYDPDNFDSESDYHQDFLDFFVM